MSRGKLGLVLTLLVVALVGGFWLADWLTLWLLGVNAPLVWNTWWQYVRVVDLPQYAPYAGKIKLAGAVGFGLPLLAWLLLVLPLLRRRRASLHGDASFATLADLRSAGLLKQTPESILIGSHEGRYLWLGGSRHVIAISPTRSGKTTSIAIPVLLTYQHSIVVLDVKGELFKATSGWRGAQGHAIRVWAPYDESGQTHRFNPMTALAGMDAGKRMGEIQTMAAILYPDESGEDPFWTSQARAAFTAFASFLFEAWDADMLPLVPAGAPRTALPHPDTSPKFPSFERILRLSSGADGGGIKATLDAILSDSRYAYVSPQTRTVFRNLCGLAKQTFSSVLATMQAPLQQFLNPLLAAATNGTDFDLASLRKRPTTLYVIVPANKLDESGKLLNVFFSSVIGANLDRQLGEALDLKYQLLMLMDEFTAMGRVEAWARRISVSAGYGVRDLCIVQSRAQLRSAYGDDDAQNFITNHGVQIVFAPREQADANEYSEMLGYRTLRRKHRSTSRGRGVNQVSINFTEEKRALLLPQEVKELPQDEELIFHEGYRPIRAKKNWFFKDRALRQRAAIAPARVRTAVPDPRRAHAADVVTQPAAPPAE
ncbi:MAG: type IV secretory system conjugative DNA transfer family protein [Rhodanobacteraceae bacterium]